MTYAYTPTEIEELKKRRGMQEEYCRQNMSQRLRESDQRYHQEKRNEMKDVTPKNLEIEE